MQPTKAYILFNALFDFGMSFSITSYAPYLLSLGLGLSDVSLINACFWGMILIAELPTGMFADRVSRVWSVRIGSGIASIGGWLYASAVGFTTSLIYELVLGIGFSFISGALGAWIKDTITNSYPELSEDERYLLHKRTVATSGIIRAVVVMAGGVLGGLLADWSYRAVWLVTGACMSAACYVSNCCMVVDHRAPHAQAQSTLTQSWKVMRSRPGLLWAVLAAMSFGLVLPFNHFWAPFFALRIGQSALGWMWIPMQGALALASYAVRRSGDTKFFGASGIAVALAASGVGLALMGSFAGLSLPLLFIVLHEAGRGLFMPLLEIFTQQRVEQEYRATYGSLQSFLARIGYASILIWAWWSTHDLPPTEETIHGVWQTCGWLLAAVALLLWFFRVKER